MYFVPALPGILFVDTPRRPPVDTHPSDYSENTQIYLLMHNWYTKLPLTLYAILFHTAIVSAQQTLDIQWSAQNRRQFFEVHTGQTTVNLCGLTPGGVYTVIANPANRNQGISFTWNVRTSMTHELDPQDPGQISITPSSECASLVLHMQANDQQDTKGVYFSIRRTDDEKPSDFLENFMSQVEMANLSVTSGTSANSLISNILIGGNCFDVSNVTSFGNPSSRGTFSNGTTNIGLDNGMVLCTGPVTVLPGPNNLGGASGGFSNTITNDPDLATLTGGGQRDLSRIEFDFRPTAATVTFDFVFGSEEYCEFVGQGFNDVFGFFISGPGITGNQNIALIPSTSTPVSIDNVNNSTNSSFFVPNSGTCGATTNAAECQLDGWTTVFTATANVIPCQTYHIKLAIADVGDSDYSSAVFLRANSFGNASEVVQGSAVYPSGPSFVYEGCGQGYIRFTRGSTNTSDPLDVNFTIGGTATPGVDYTPLDGSYTIPAGQTSIQIPINVIANLLAEGNETITITLDNACACTQTVTTFNIQDLLPLQATLSDINGCGSSSAVLSPSISGGQNPLTYAWSNGASSPTLNVAAPGTHTYTVTVTDACGRTATAESTVTLAPSPTAALSGSGTFCAGSVGSVVNLNLNLTGQGDWTVTYNAAGTPVTATFSSSPAVIPATQPGTYTLVSVVSDNGCTGTVSGNVNLTQTDVNLNLTPTNPTCFGLTNGSISSSPSGGTAPYTYSWTPSGTGANPNNLAPGTYSVTVTSSQGCTEVASVTLTEPPQLTADAVSNGLIDCNHPNTMIDLTVGGGTPNYTYVWTGGLSGQDPTVTTGGNYTVTVRDSKNCTATATVAVAANTAQPTASILPAAQINCNVTSVTLDASASSQGTDFTYQWSGPNIMCCSNTLQPEVGAGGTYILTVTNTTNGCTKTASVTVPSNTNLPNAVANAPFNIGCNHPTVTLNGAGSSTGAGITYQWSTGDGTINSGSTTLNPVVSQAGTYTLVVTNNNTGCVQQTSVTITGDTQLPTAVVAPAGPVDCFNPVLQLDGTGSSQGAPGFVYNWTGGSVSGGNTLTPSITAGGTYTLVVTNPTNSCTATASVTVAANLTQPNAAASAPNGINCQNSTVTLNGAGSSVGPNFSYQWTTPNGNILSGDNTLNPVVNQGGNYILVVTNNTNGCTRQVSVNVTQDQSVPVANAGTDRVLNCITPTVQLSGTASLGPGYTFSWSANPGGFASGQNTLTPSINQPGTYTLIVTNNNTGCTSSDVVEVTSNFSTPTAQILPADPITCFVPVSVLDGSNSSSGSNITYSWTGIAGGQISGNSDQPQATAATPGTYRLTVRNTESGCTATAQVTVTSNTTPPVAEAGPAANLTCQNPTVSLNGAGSSVGGSYSYQWSTTNGNIVSGGTSLTPSVNLPGNYVLVVTSSINGCTAQDFVNVTTNQNLPLANAGPDLMRTCAVSNLTINGSNSSGGAGIQYQWTANPGNIMSGATSVNPIVNQAGTYTLLVTNVNTGCTATDEVVVTNNLTHPGPIIAQPDVINCLVPAVSLDATGSTDLGTPSYHWATTGGTILSGVNTGTPLVNAPGVYSVTITNTINSCTSTAQVTVAQDKVAPNAAAQVNAILSCQNAQVQLSGTGSSSGGGYLYQWTTSDGHIVSGAQTLTPTVDEAGVYTLQVTSDQNGCTKTASVTVISSQQFPTANAGPNRTLTCATGQLSLDGTGSSQGSNFAYIWDTQNGNIVADGSTLTPSIDAPGTYTLNIVDETNGCTATASVTVDSNYLAPAATVAPGGVLSCTVSSVSLDGTGSSTGNAYGYAWQTQNGNILSGGTTLQPVINAVGTYTLVVTDNGNGCTSTASTSVQADASLPVANAGTPDTLTCSVSSIVINATTSSQGGNYAYTWSGPGTISSYSGLQPTVDQPGEYRLTVTNQTNGCTALSTVAIARDVTAPVANAGATDELTCTKTTIALDGSASSTGTLYEYQWTALNGGQIAGGGTTLAPTVNAPGLYRLRVTNSFNDCVTEDTVAISQDIAIPTVDAGPPATLTCVVPSISLAGTGSTDPLFVYSWTTPDGNIASGDSTLTPLVDAPGIYNLLVTNAYNGCSSTDAVTIDRDANVPDAVAEVNGELNCVTASLQLSGENSTQGATLEYTWNTTDGNIVSGNNSLTPVVNAPGLYTLRVFNTANSCVALSTVEVLENKTAPVAEAGNPQVLSCTHPELTLDGTGSSTGPQFTYKWNTDDGNFISEDTALQALVDRSGLYTLVVTDLSNGCTSESDVQIFLDQNTPESVPGPDRTLTCAVTSLSLDGTSSSAGAQFSYLWTTLDGQIVSGDNTLTPVVASPGTYTLIITNVNNGCVSDASVLVDENVEPPVAQAEFLSTLTCTNQTTGLNIAGSSAGPDFKYSWTTTGGLILSGSNTATPTVGDPGLYQLVVENTATGCTNTATVTVPENVTPPAVATAVSGVLTCAIPQLPLSGAGSSAGLQYQYLWSTTNGAILNGATTLTPTIGDPGVYSLQVTDNVNGCTSTSSVAVSENITPPVVNATVNSLLTCAVTQIQLNGTATGGTQGVSYAWTGQGIVSGANTQTPTVNATGLYTLTATDLFNGCTASDPVTVSADVVHPTISIATPAQLNCYVAQTVIQGSGSLGGQYTYAWTGTYIVQGANTLTPTVNGPGAYNLLITNTSNGCTSTQSTTVLQDIQIPVAQAGGAFELTCSVVQGNLNANGSASGNGINYVWNTSNGHIVSGANSATPVVNEPGVYALTVVNAQTGCTNTASVTVTENTNYPDALTLSRVLPKCGGQPGSLVIETVTGGVGPYLYSIDGGNTFNAASAFEGLTPGTYQMVVQDVNGCEYAQNLTLPVPVEPQVSLNPDISLTYGQDAKLVAALNIPLSQVDTIIWSPSETLTKTDKINEVIARPFKDTEYTVRIINLDGCEDVAKILVRVSDPQIFVPNVFSPGKKDNNSDFFTIFSSEGTINKIHSLQVYDRWGTMVFQRKDMLPNDEKLGWDGSFRGKELNPAVFVWWADVELADGSHIVLKGDVTIAD